MEYNPTFNKGDKVFLSKRPDLGLFEIASVIIYPRDGMLRVTYTIQQELFVDDDGYSVLSTIRGMRDNDLEFAPDVYQDGYDIILTDE